MKFALTLWTALALSSSGLASDHIDGPVTSAHPQTDITDLYAFPAPNKPGQLVMVMNVNPAAAPSSHLVENVEYAFVLRKARIENRGFATRDEVRISCRAETPHDHDAHQLNCETSNGFAASALVGKEQSQGDFQVFFGVRSDPFFINFMWAAGATSGTLPEPSQGNSMDRLNVVSIVVEIDAAKILGYQERDLVAVTALTASENPAPGPSEQLDWVGRPEVTNVTMIANGQRDIRDLYNKETPFAISLQNKSLYQTRISENILMYDRADAGREWDADRADAMAKILLDDFLVVDLSKACSRNEFLSIEKAVLRGKIHSSCGGRLLEDDIMDQLFTFYVNADQGPIISDGADQPWVKSSEQFPYLQPANTGFWAWKARQVARILMGLAN